MQKNNIVFFDIDYTLFDTSLFKESNFSKHKAYKEVEDVLIEIKKIADLGIFSEGEIELQKKKLRETNLLKYFINDNLHIVSDKLSELEEIFGEYKDKKVFLVDDKLLILSDVKKLFPNIFTVWVRRGMYAEKQKEIKGFRPDAEVDNLEKIALIVKSNL